VATESDKQVCYVARAGRQERREVETGDFNDEFIEVKKGIKEGEKVCLRSPEDTGDKEKKAETPGTPKPQPSPAPATPQPAK
jgi:hypothetical protein